MKVEDNKYLLIGRVGGYHFVLDASNDRKQLEGRLVDWHGNAPNGSRTIWKLESAVTWNKKPAVKAK